MNLEQERQAFEAWFSTTDSYKLLSMPGAHSPFYQAKEGVYINTRIECLWQAWLARAKVSPWVSVEKGLPEVCKKVLICIHGGHVLKDWYTYHMEDGTFRFTNGDKVTHWMPLPEPPK